MLFVVAVVLKSRVLLLRLEDVDCLLLSMLLFLGKKWGRSECGRSERVLRWSEELHKLVKANAVWLW